MKRQTPKTKSTITALQIDLTGWSFADWGERIIKDCVEIEVDQNSKHINIDFNFFELEDVVAEKILRENVEAFFTECQMNIDRKGFYCADYSHDEPVWRVNWQGNLYLDDPMHTIPAFAKWAIDQMSHQFDNAEQENEKTQEWWRKTKAVLLELKKLEPKK